MDNQYYLTADEIREFDNINADKRAAELTLEIALTHHENRMSSLNLLVNKIWDDMTDKMGLNQDDIMNKNIVCHIVKRHGQMVAVVKSFKDEKED